MQTMPLPHCQPMQVWTCLVQPLTHPRCRQPRLGPRLWHPLSNCGLQSGHRPRVFRLVIDTGFLVARCYGQGHVGFLLRSRPIFFLALLSDACNASPYYPARLHPLLVHNIAFPVRSPASSINYCLNEAFDLGGGGDRIFYCHQSIHDLALLLGAEAICCKTRECVVL